MTRLRWDDYFLKMLEAVSERATCDRGRSGCIITKDRQIIATGYVGAPPGFPHCDDVGHLLEAGHCVRTVHAEQNAIASAARRGVALAGGTCYSTMAPCRTCAMLLVTIGVTKVVSTYEYQNRVGAAILDRAGIAQWVANEEVPYDPAK